MVLWRCLFLLAGLFAGSVAWAAEVAADIVFVTGTVMIQGGDGSLRPAGKGAELRSGEIIDTTPDGRAQMRFRDGATMSLQPATRFRVDDYRFSGAAAANADDKGFFSLLKGGFRTISGLIGKVRREQYRVSTSVATIGIRGTGYSANLDEGGLNLATQSGVIEVCNAAGCVLVRAGESAVAAANDRKPELKASGGGIGGVDLPQPQFQVPTAGTSSDSSSAAPSSATASAPPSAASPSTAPGQTANPLTAQPMGARQSSPGASTAPLR